MYWINLFIALDRFVNVLCKGHINSTVSARVGYFAFHYRTQGEGRGRYWRALEYIINYVFKPIDGPNHCYNAMVYEAAEYEYEDGNDFARALLAWIVIFFCGLASIPFRIATALKPAWRYRQQK